MVQHGVNGFTVPVEDPGAVAARLLELMASEALRKRMGEEGRRIFTAHFTLERFWQNMEAALLAASRPI